AVLDRLCDPLWVPRRRAFRRAEAAHLRGDDGLAAARTEGAAEELLRLPAAVALSGVEVVHAGIEAGVDDRLGAPFVHPHAEVVASQPGDGDLERTNVAQLR